MAAALTEDARKQANLRLLQRSIDANIQDIVGGATHVVLYEYIAPQGWEKSQVEGSLFLVASQSPLPFQQQSFALAILNRHSTENFQVPITERFQLQHKEPYLIFKQSPKILGIWFHNTNERVIMASLLNQVIQNLQQSAIAAVPVPPPTPKPPVQPTMQSYPQQPPPQQQPASGLPVFSPVARQMPPPTPSAAVTTTPSTSRHQASLESPSHLIEPLMNSLFVSDNNHNATAEGRHSTTPATPGTTPSSGNTTPTRSIPGVALDKKSLQLALLSLIQDDRFIDLLHAQYLKVAHARAHRNNKK
jgi:mRNA-decapping enzyme 1B